MYPSIKLTFNSHSKVEVYLRQSFIYIMKNYIKKIQPEAEQNKIKMEQETINEGKNVLAKTEHTEIPKDLPPLEDSDSMQEE
jgi:hypothetical protein